MASFTFAELGDKSNEVAEAAFSGPVDITAQGKRKFVLMTVEQFDRLRQANQQKTQHIDDMEEDERDSLIAALETVARTGGA
jgi:antitoxin Phd